MVHGPGLSISQLVRAQIAQITELTASRRFRLTVYRKPAPSGQLTRAWLPLTGRLTADPRQADRRDLAIRRRLTGARRLNAYRKPAARMRLTRPRLAVDRKVPGGRREVRARQLTIYWKPVASGQLSRSGLARISELTSGRGRGAAGCELAGSGILTAGTACRVLAAKG
jgi:hypothetical protein